MIKISNNIAHAIHKYISFTESPDILTDEEEIYINMFLEEWYNKNMKKQEVNKNDK